MKKLPPLHENWLEGLPLQPNDAIPALIAAQYLEGFTEDAVRNLSEELIGLFGEWKNEHGEPPQPMGLLGIAPAIADAEPWQCAGFSVNDPVDLLERLIKDEYTPAMELVDRYGTAALYSILALRELAIVSKNPRLAFGIIQNRHTETAMKATLLVLLAEERTDIDRRVNDKVQRLIPRIVDAAKRQDRSAVAKLAANARNKDFKALRAKAIEMYNEHPGKFKNPRHAATLITPRLEKYGKDQLGTWLTTDDPRERVYRWLLDAKKRGQLKNP
jgi:hypothetical protein